MTDIVERLPLELQNLVYSFVPINPVAKIVKTLFATATNPHLMTPMNRELLYDSWFLSVSTHKRYWKTINDQIVVENENRKIVPHDDNSDLHFAVVAYMYITHQLKKVIKLKKCMDRENDNRYFIEFTDQNKAKRWITIRDNYVNDKQQKQYSKKSKVVTAKDIQDYYRQFAKMKYLNKICEQDIEYRLRNIV